MATATLQNVYDAARSWLSDNGLVSAGEIFTNAVLQPHFATAYRKMYDSLGCIGSPRIRREFYHILPAETSIFIPSSVGIQDLAEPEFLDERKSVAAVAIAATGITSPIQVTTAAPHGYASNATEVIVAEVAGTQAPWGRWFVTVVDPLNFTLNGSVSDGVAGTGGVASTSNDKFTPCNPLDSLTDRDISDSLCDYAWEEGYFKFRGCSQPVQIRVTYVASGVAPTITTQSIGLDNCLNFLAAYTAAIAAGSKGWTTMAAGLERRALGSSEKVGSGGYLRDFMNIQVKTMQRTQRRRRPFRKKRTQFDAIWT
jgi:hypothetical protein